MKKLLFFLLVLSLFPSFVTAQNEGIGLSAGLEFGIGNINEAYGSEKEPYLTPVIIYERSFLDDTLDFYAELDYTFEFTKVPNNDGKVFPQSLYFDIALGYNLGLGSASTLSFIAEHELDEIMLSPRDKDGRNMTGIFTPAVKFSQKMSLGDIHTQIGVPITYMQNYKDAGMEMEFSLVLGWESTFDLAVEVETVIPISQEVKEAGITITPEFAYSLKNFTFYVNSEFAGIGVLGGSVIVTPALGLKYRF